MLSSLVGANYWLLAVSLVPLVLFLVMRAFRWRLFFYPKQGLHLVNLFAVINIGYLLSNIFPARLGDVAAPTYRRYGGREPSVRLLDRCCRAGAGCLVRRWWFFYRLAICRSARMDGALGSVVGVLALVAVVVFVVLVRRRNGHCAWWSVSCGRSIGPSAKRWRASGRTGREDAVEILCRLALGGSAGWERWPDP